MSAPHSPTSWQRGPLLTQRQGEVFQLIAAGHPDKEIAIILRISEETVAYHVRIMFYEQDVHCRAALVAKLAQRLGRDAEATME